MSMTTARFLRGRPGAVLVAIVALLHLSCGRTAATAVEASSGGIAVIGGESSATGAATTTATSRDDLLDERRIVPVSVGADPSDPATLVVRFDGGVAPCHGARLAVDEGPASVTVLLFAGTPPEGIGAVCPAVVRPQELRWTLERPLGTREIHSDAPPS